MASRIESIMPESYEGENFCRAERLARGPINEATREHINIAIFKLSNKLDTKLSWSQRLQVLETSGIMSTRVQLNQHWHSGGLMTISALAEVLYQNAFEYLYDTRSYEESDNLQPRSAKLVGWLLSLGYPSDTYVSLKTSRDTRNNATGLQIATFCENYELACVLLDAGANPNQLSHHIDRSDGDKVFLLPPLSLALSRESSPGRNAIIRRLVDAGADIEAEQKSERGFLTKVSTLSTLVSYAEEEETEIQEIMDLLCIGQAKFVTADVLISAAWHGKMRNLELVLRINPDINMANPLGLTALHAAAYQGHTDICEMLLQKGSSVDSSDQDAPSPLHLASYADHVDIVAMLHRHGASILRGIDVNKDNNAVVSLRYFPDASRVGLPDWRVSLLDRPIGAAMYASNFEGENAYKYLMQHGAKLPPLAVYLAADRRNPQLLSLALQQDLDPDHLGPDDCTPLQRAMIDVQENEKSACVQIASDLLDKNARIKGGEAILALSNLESWEIVERILSSDRHDVSQRTDLMPSDWSCVVRGSIGATLLETAILGGSQSMTEHVLAVEPSQYSAGALCAACLQVARGVGTLALLERMLQNRANVQDVDKEDLVRETTAVGIAAWSGNSVMLKTLHAHIPVSNLAYLPNDDTSVKLASMAADQPDVGDTGPLSFWHESRYNAALDCCPLGSPLNFALDKPKILDQLLRYGYKFDRISLVMMADLGDTSTVRSLVQGRDIVDNEYASKMHSPLHHAITNGDLEMSTFLLDFGEDINDNENEIESGRSPLARAVEKNHLPLIEMLLNAGADVNAPPALFDGMTALQCAAAQGSLGIAKQLIDLGANMNAGCCENGGLTALEAAAQRGRIDMVQLLLSEGVETTENGRRQYIVATAFAERQGHYVTANILKKHRPWTDEDWSIWKYTLRMYIPEGWRQDHDERFGMASAAEEEANACGGHSAWKDTETSEEDDSMDWDSSDSTARNAASSSAPNVVNQCVVAEPGFAVEVDGIDVDAIDWDGFWLTVLLS